VCKFGINYKNKFKVKPFPKSHKFSFVFSGLEDTSIYLWGNNSILSNKLEKKYVDLKIKIV
jgi:hypothetical protein